MMQLIAEAGSTPISGCASPAAFMARDADGEYGRSATAGRIRQRLLDLRRTANVGLRTLASVFPRHCGSPLGSRLDITCDQA